MNRHVFVSRTQKSIRSIPTMALQARVKGVSSVSEGIGFTKAQGQREVTRELIASLNYSVNQCRKELAFRNKK